MMQVIIVVPAGDVNLSSITGAYQVLSRANQYFQQAGNKPKMRIGIAGYVKELTLDAGFFSIHPTDISAITKADLVIIPSISYDYENSIKANTALIEWIRNQYNNGAEIASICTGAFLLAATGLLEGKRCSTHWNAAADFRRLFPNIQLQPDKLVTVQQGIYTNGGAYSFLNLLLFMIEKYFDRHTAVLCSKIFQIDIDRASQSPFFIFQAQKSHGDELVGHAQAYIEAHLEERISFEALALKLAISRRNFDRRFAKATGNTPVEYLQRVKVEVAKKALETGCKSIFEVMNEVGYSDGKAFREVFKKLTGLSPLAYKTKYGNEAIEV